MSAPLRVTRHSTIDEIDGYAELVRSPRLYESQPWLRYCELLSGGRLTYLVARDHDDVPLGVTTARIVAPGQVMSLYDLGSVFDEPAPASLYPNVVSAVSGSHYVEAIRTQRDQGGIRAALGRGLVDLASQSGCSAVGALYIHDAETAAQLSTAIDAAPPFMVAAQTMLSGAWSDFDDYLQSLKRSRRNKVRRERRECHDSGVRISVNHGAGSLDEDTARLQLALREKYAVGGSIDSILTDYDHLRRTVDDHIVVFRAEVNGELVGMSLALLDGDRLHLRLVGFDYAKSSDFLYFNMLFYAPIEWGTQQGITSYAFGTSSYPAKLSRGCVPEPLYAVVRWPEELRNLCSEQARAYEERLRQQCGMEREKTP